MASTICMQQSPVVPPMVDYSMNIAEQIQPYKAVQHDQTERSHAAAFFCVAVSWFRTSDLQHMVLLAVPTSRQLSICPFQV
jgi:hypothetical protein